MDCSQSRRMGCFALVNRTMFAEDQFAFAPGVAGIDQRVHVVALDQFFQGPSAALGFLNRQQNQKCGGMTGRCLNVHLPRAASTPSGGTMVSRWPTADENDVLVAFVVIALFLEPAERFGDVAGDGRFLRNDENFAHFYTALVHRAGQTCEENLFCQIQPAK